MELKTDFLKIEKKSTLRIIGGAGFLLLTITWIVVKIMRDKIIDYSDMFFMFVFAGNGFVHIAGGLGFSIPRLFGKSFINIDEQSITVKMGLFEKGQHLEWAEIQALEYMANKYRVTRNDGTSGILNLSKMDYLLKKEVKEVIAEIAKGKGILIG